MLTRDDKALDARLKQMYPKDSTLEYVGMGTWDICMLPLELTNVITGERSVVGTTRYYTYGNRVHNQRRSKDARNRQRRSK